MADRSDLESMKYRLAIWEQELEIAIDNDNNKEINRLIRLIDGLKNEIKNIEYLIETEKE